MATRGEAARVLQHLAAALDRRGIAPVHVDRRLGWRDGTLDAAIAAGDLGLEGLLAALGAAGLDPGVFFASVYGSERPGAATGGSESGPLGADDREDLPPTEEVVELFRRLVRKGDRASAGKKG